MEVGLRDFTHALREYARATGKECPEIVNRAARDVAFKAFRYTPKSDPAKIRGELSNNGLAFALLQGLPASRLPIQLSGWGNRSLTKRTRAEINDAAKQFIAHRAASSKATSVAWLKVAQGIGGTAKVSRGAAVSDRGNPGKSTGTPATLSRLVAILVNRANGSVAVGIPALEQAISEVAANKLAYSQRKLAQIAKGYSAK